MKAFFVHFYEVCKDDNLAGDVFETFFSILVQFHPIEHQFIAKRLKKLLDVLVDNFNIISNFKNIKSNYFTFAILHFLFYYLPHSLDHVAFMDLILRANLIPISLDDSSQKQISLGKLEQSFHQLTTDSKGIGTTQERKFDTLPSKSNQRNFKANLNTLTKTQSFDIDVDYQLYIKRIQFCIQLLSIKYINIFQIPPCTLR